MQGGVNPDLGLEWYTNLITELTVRHPTISLDCFSPIEIEGIAEVSGLTTMEVLSEFKEAGMHGLPGGGARRRRHSDRRRPAPSIREWKMVRRPIPSAPFIAPVELAGAVFLG